MKYSMRKLLCLRFLTSFPPALPYLCVIWSGGVLWYHASYILVQRKNFPLLSLDIFLGSITHFQSLARSLSSEFSVALSGTKTILLIFYGGRRSANYHITHLEVSNLHAKQASNKYDVESKMGFSC